MKIKYKHICTDPYIKIIRWDYFYVGGECKIAVIFWKIVALIYFGGCVKSGHVSRNPVTTLFDFLRGTIFHIIFHEFDR